jgi:phosphoglycerate kinase
VDEEVDDIKRISDAGGVTVILAHEGRYGKAKSLEFVANYLTEKLQRKVHYYPNPVYGQSIGFLANADKAIEFTEMLKPGEIAIMGNVRQNEGEDVNSPELAYLYAHLGDKVVIGGFGKAHRREASNNGILDYRNGYLSSSQEQQMQKLKRWSGRSDDYSVAVIGGMKKEKIKDGLLGFAEIYDHVIPGGIVLNTILKLKYEHIGRSKIDDDGKTFEEDVKNALKKYSKKIIIPKEVIVASQTEKGLEYSSRINFEEFGRVPEDCMIVSYVMPSAATYALAQVAQEKGRLVVAGTPDIPNLQYGKMCYSIASSQLKSWLPQIGSNALILGGDTARDLEPKDSVISTGGGSALMYLTLGTTHAYEKLRENFQIRGGK